MLNPNFTFKTKLHHIQNIYNNKFGSSWSKSQGTNTHLKDAER